MDTTTIAQPAPRLTTEKTPRLCAGCGEPAGSISAGTGYPLVGKKGAPMYHVKCKPGTPSGKAGAAVVLAGAL